MKKCCKCEKCYTALRVFALLAMASVAVYAAIRWWDEILTALEECRDKLTSLLEKKELPEAEEE